MGFINDVLGRNDRKDARRLAAEGQFSPFRLFGPGGSSVQFGTVQQGPSTSTRPPVGINPGSLPGGGNLNFNKTSPPAGFFGQEGGSARLSPERLARFDQIRQTLGLGPFPRGGPGGGGGGGGSSFSPDAIPGQDIVLDPGNLGGARDALLGLFGQSAQGAQGGLPGFLQGAGAGAANDLQRNPALEAAFGFANDQQLAQAFGGASQSALQTAQQDPSVLADERLGILREQAQPQEQRAFNRLQDQLFASGRSGTTGGGIQTEAFARGLGQADLSRQLAAFDFARGIQQDASQRALGFGGLRDDLTSSSLNRQLGLREDAANRATQRFGIAQSLFDSTLRGRSSGVQDAINSLSGVTGIDNNSLQQFQAALNAAAARSNAALGGSSNLAGLGANPIVGGKDIASFFSNLF